MKKHSKLNQSPSTIEARNSKKQTGERAKSATGGGEQQPAVQVFTDKDKSQLETLEKIIASNVGGFLLMGEALSTIKNADLQKVTDLNLTFDTYCATKWGFSDKYAYKLINAFECVKHLKTQMELKGVTAFPVNEAQVRPLTKLSPEDQVAAWAEVLNKASGGPITAKLVDEVIMSSNGDETSVAATPEEAEAPSTKPAAKNKVATKTITAIAKIVEKAKKLEAADLSVEKLLKFIEQIEKLVAAK